MKKQLNLGVFLLIGSIVPIQKSHAQLAIAEIVQAGIKKVIIAIDLKIQRLQTKTIWLQNVQKELENTMSQLHLDQITFWVQQQKDLYQSYFDELWKVKDAIITYHKVKQI